MESKSYSETLYHSAILCHAITQKIYNISSIMAKASDYMHFNIIMLQNILCEALEFGWRKQTSNMSVADISSPCTLKCSQSR